MTPSRLAHAAGAAALVLVAGCEEPAVSYSPTARSSAVEGGGAASSARPAHDVPSLEDRMAQAPHGSGIAAGVEGFGFRATGSTANGITP